MIDIDLEAMMLSNQRTISETIKVANAIKSNLSSDQYAEATVVIRKYNELMNQGREAEAEAVKQQFMENGGNT